MHRSSLLYGLLIMMHHERANMWSGWAVVRYRGGFAGLDWKEGLRFPIAFWGRFGWAWASSGFTIAFRLERLTPLSLKGRSRRSESKGQRVIFEGYWVELINKFLFLFQLLVITMQFNIFLNSTVKMSGIKEIFLKYLSFNYDFMLNYLFIFRCNIKKN